RLRVADDGVVVVGLRVVGGDGGAVAHEDVAGGLVVVVALRHREAGEERGPVAHPVVHARVARVHGLGEHEVVHAVVGQAGQVRLRVDGVGDDRADGVDPVRGYDVPREGHVRHGVVDD